MIQPPRFSQQKLIPTLPGLPLSLPQLGRIAAGVPLEAIEDRKRGELLSMLVEQVDHPEWRAKPITLTNGDIGTCIITCFYEARAASARTARWIGSTSAMAQ